MAFQPTYGVLLAVAIIGTSGILPAQQGAQTSSGEPNVTSERNIRERELSRQRWQSAGRKVPGANPASLRARAIQQKLQMRSSSAFNFAATTGAWASLGPKPLPSDASGTGLQDYGFVSGRATAVAIDPND